MKHLLRIWTGPTLVHQLAEKLTEAGIEVCERGTEHVIVKHEGMDAAGASWNVIADLMRKHGTDFGLRPKSLGNVA